MVVRWVKYFDFVSIYIANESFMGSGGGQMVRELAIYSNDPSLNPADAYSFSIKFVFEKNRNKQKIGRGWPIFNKSFVAQLAAKPTGSNPIIGNFYSEFCTVLYCLKIRRRRGQGRPIKKPTNSGSPEFPRILECWERRRRWPPASRTSTPSSCSSWSALSSWKVTGMP